VNSATTTITVSAATLSISPASWTPNGYGDFIGFKATSTQTLPTGTQFKWTCTTGNLSSKYQSFVTNHSVTSTNNYVYYTDVTGKDGSSGADTLKVQALDSKGNVIAQASESLTLAARRFQEIIYPSGGVQSIFEYVPGLESCPASVRQSDYVTNYNGDKLDCFQVESATPYGSGQAPLLGFGLIVPSGAFPSVGEKFAVQYYSYLPYLVPGIAQYSGSLSVTFPNDSVNGTLTITSSAPDPRGGTFYGYSFTLDTDGGNTTGFGLATLK
jgi:hypothetical protein